VAALLGSSPASAQTRQASETGRATNGDILVLAAKLEESTPENSRSTARGSRRSKARRSTRAATTDTGAALQMLVPGLYVSPKSGAFDYVDVSLLGSRTSEVLFTVDGVRIGNRLYTGTRRSIRSPRA
jgi:vitamin B12 transporter